MRHWTFLRGSAMAMAVVAGMAAVPAAAEGLSHAASRAARSLALGGVRAGTMELRDVTFGASGSGPSIGRMLFTGFKRDGGRVHADRVDFENVRLALGPQVTTIPAITMSAVDLPEALFRGLSEGDASVDWAGLLMQTAIGEIAIERIEQRDDTAHVQAIDRDIAVRGIKDGIVASARIGGIDGSAPAAPSTPGEVKFHMGEIRYEQANLAESIRYFTGGGSGESKHLLERAVIHGMDITTPDAIVRIGRFEMAAIDGRAPAKPFPAAAQAQAGLDNLPKDADARAQALGYAADLLQYMRIGRYSIEQITVEVPKEGRRFSIGAITLSGWSSRGLDRFEVDGVDIPTPEASVRLDRFELRGLSYGALIDAALKAARAGDNPELSPQEIARVLPHLAGLRLSRFDVRTPKGPVSLRELRFDADETPEDTSAELALDGLKIDVAHSEPNPDRDQLIALGYGDLEMSADLRLRSSPREHSLAVEKLRLVVDQAGRLEVRARLDNVDFAKMMADVDNAEQVLDQAQLGPIEVQVVDLGLAERFYAQNAKQSGVSPDAIRAGLAAEMRARAMQQLGPALDQPSADAIAAFLQSPGTISARIVAAADGAPVSLADIKNLDPPMLMQRLRVKLEVAPK